MSPRQLSYLTAKTFSNHFDANGADIGLLSPSIGIELIPHLDLETELTVESRFQDSDGADNESPSDSDDSDHFSQLDSDTTVTVGSNNQVVPDDNSDPGSDNNGNEDDGDDDDFHQACNQLGLSQAIGIDPSLTLVDVIARCGVPTFNADNRERKLMQKLMLIGFYLISSNFYGAEDNSRALLLIYSAPSIVSTLSRRLKRANPIRKQQLQAIYDLIFQQIFDNIEDDALNGDEAELPAWDDPFQLVQAADRFHMLVRRLDFKLNVPEVDFAFRAKIDDPRNAVSAALLCGRTGKALNIIEDTDRPNAEMPSKEAAIQRFVQLHPAPPIGEEPMPTVPAALADGQEAVARWPEEAPLLPAVADPATMLEFNAVLLKCNTNSSGGCDGMTFAVLKKLTEVSNASAGRPMKQLSKLFSEALRGYCNRLLAVRDVTENERQLLTAGKMVFIPKGDNSWRPIGITSAICRVVGKIVLKRAGSFIGDSLKNLQLALGISDGCTLGAAIDQSYLDRGGVTLFFDMINAFNNCSRRRAYDQMRLKLPTLLPLFALLYGAPSQALIAKGISLGTIRSGVKQGCPLAMIAFCLTIHPLLEALQKHTEDCTIAFLEEPIQGEDYDDFIGEPKVLGYADDTRVNIDWRLFFKTPMLIMEPANYYSLENPSPWLRGCLELIDAHGFVNHPDKMMALSKVIHMGFNNRIAQKDNGLMDLGVPIGSRSFIAETVKQKALQASSLLLLAEDAPPGGLRPPHLLLKRLPKQDQLQIIKQCVAVRIHHLFRSIPLVEVNAQNQVVDMMKRAAIIFDNRLRKWLRNLSVLSEDRVEDVYFDVLRSVSTARGGLGIRSFTIAHYFYARKLYCDASKSLCAQANRLCESGSLSVGTLAQIRINRSMDVDHPLGSELWARNVQQPHGYLGHTHWQTTLYPNGIPAEGEPGARISYEVLETALLHALRQQILLEGTNELVNPEVRKAALALQLSMQSGASSMFTRPGGSLYEAVSDEAFRRWLGLLFLAKPILPQEILHRCCNELVNGALIDLRHYPHHLLFCKKSQGFISLRHDAVVEILAMFFQRAVSALDPANGEVRLENEAKVNDVIASLRPPVAYGVTFNRAQRGNDAAKRLARADPQMKGDILLLYNGMQVLIDVVVCNPASRKAIAAGSYEQEGIAAAQRRGEKNTKYARFLPSPLTYQDSFRFVVFAIEVGGTIDQPAMTWLNEFLVAAGMGGDLQALLGLLTKSMARTTNAVMKNCRNRVTQLAPEGNPVAEAVAEDGDA